MSSLFLVRTSTPKYISIEQASPLTFIFFFPVGPTVGYLLAIVMSGYFKILMFSGTVLEVNFFISLRPAVSLSNRAIIGCFTLAAANDVINFTNADALLSTLYSSKSIK